MASLQSRQLLTLHMLQKRPTRRRDVVDVIGHTKLLDRGDRVAAVGQSGALAFGQVLGDRLGAGLDWFEPAQRPVPDHRSIILNNLRQARCRILPDIQDVGVTDDFTVADGNVEVGADDDPPSFQVDLVEGLHGRVALDLCRLEWECDVPSKRRKVAPAAIRQE